MMRLPASSATFACHAPVVFGAMWTGLGGRRSTGRVKEVMDMSKSDMALAKRSKSWPC